mmetsp:Transcript_19737/g.45391  ORF Transcript_19737/g.45391 Transcript_19737/m.45391 type:complete len:283 (+) Transcript_19737:594-1442(+)
MWASRNTAFHVWLSRNSTSEVSNISMQWFLHTLSWPCSSSPRTSLQFLHTSSQGNRADAGRKQNTRCATSFGSSIPRPIASPTMPGLSCRSTVSGTGMRELRSQRLSACSTHPRISLRGMPSFTRSVLPESFLGVSTVCQSRSPLPTPKSPAPRWPCLEERCDEVEAAKRAANCEGTVTISVVGSLDHWRRAKQMPSIPIETSSVSPPLYLVPLARRVLAEDELRGEVWWCEGEKQGRESFFLLDDEVEDDGGWPEPEAARGGRWEQGVPCEDEDEGCLLRR